MRESPLASAAVIGGVVAAGAFLWSRRNEIRDQIGDLADQINDWRDTLTSGSGSRDGAASSDRSVARGDSPDSQRTQAEIAEEALTLKQLGEPA